MHDSLVGRILSSRALLLAGTAATISRNRQQRPTAETASTWGRVASNCMDIGEGGREKLAAWIAGEVQNGRCRMGGAEWEVQNGKDRKVQQGQKLVVALCGTTTSILISLACRRCC